MAGMINTLMAFPSRTLSTKGMIIYPDAETQALTAAEIIDWAVTENAGEHLPLGGASASTVRLRLDNRAGEWKSGGSILGAHVLDGAVIGIEIGAQHPEYSGSYDTIDGNLPTTTYANTADGGSPGSSFSDVIDGGIPFNFPHVEWYWTRIGEYVVEKPKLTEMVVELSGSDYLANRATKAFSDGLTYPRTVSQILQSACSQAGITLKSASFPNASVSIPVKPLWDENTTCRDVISYVACVAGGFARIDRTGNLEIVPFDDTNDYSIGTDRYIDLERKTTFGALNALTVFPHGTKENAVRVATDIDLEDTDQNSTAVQGNPLLRYESAALTPLITGIFSVLGGLAFESAKVIWQGDPTLAVGDVLTVTDKGGATCPILVLRQVLTFASGFGMTSENSMRTATSGTARNMRIFTPSGRLNAAALEGDINIRAGRKLNLLSDADMSIKAGANFDLGAGKGKSGIGMSNYREDNVFMWAGADTPANAPFRVTMDGELTASSIGGGLVIPVANGGTGYNRQTIHRGTDYPSSGFGQDGDLFVFYNGQADTSWSAQMLTYGTAGQNTYFGVNRNWNQVPTAGFHRFGNGVGSSAYDFGAYAYFTAPAAVNSLTFTFVTAKYYNSTWYGYSGTTTYKVALVKASNMSVILASTTCYASQSQNTQTVTLTTAANMVQGDAYYIAVYFDGSDEKTSAGIVGSIEMQGKVSNSRTFDLLLKSGGEWRALLGNG